MKIIISTILAALMVLTAIVVVPVGAATEGDWEYEIVDGAATITHYRGHDAEVTIRDTLGGCPVTKIGSGAFRLKSLTSVVIPDSVTVIGEGAFHWCSSLTSVVIPASVTEIDNRAFCGCTSLTRVDIPSGVTTIGYLVFSGCDALTSVNISDSVSTIGEGAFSGCSSLTTITVDSANQAYTCVDGVLYDKSVGTLVACPGTRNSIDIPDSVTTISRSAFSFCTALTDIVIPDGMSAIGHKAFNHCTALTSVVIPDSVTEISDDVFSYCTALTGVDIPDSVTKIGPGAFEGCTALTDIVIPDSVSAIYHGAFEGCTSLTSITIPDSVTMISSSAFKDCTSLTGITIPDSVSAIGHGAFGGCSSLETVYYGGSKKKWAKISINNFYGCNAPLFNAKIIFNSADPGDVNGDGKVNMWDAIAIIRYLVGWCDAGIDPTVADYDANGRINARDVIMLLTDIANGVID